MKTFKKSKTKKSKTKKDTTEKKNEYDIIILGGGIAGIYTIYQLIKNPIFSQKRILLLEKTGRLGGRVYSTNPYKNHPEDIIEAGAGRFSQKHILLNKLIHELNLENQIEKTSSNAEYFPINREKNQESVLTTIINKNNNPIELIQNPNVINPLKNTLLSGKPKITELILKVIVFSKLETMEYLRTISFVEYAKTKEILTDAEIQQIIDSFGFYSELIIMNTYDAIQLMNNLDPESNIFCTLKGGLSQINERMIEYVIENNNNNPFHINQNVINIQQFSQNQYIIKTQNRNYKTKIIISALPKQILERISFFKPVYPWISKIKCSPLCRIYSRYKRSDQKRSDQKRSDQKQSQDLWFQNLPKMTTNNNLRMVIPINKEKGIIMISYTDNKFAEYWNNLYKKEGINKVNEELKIKIQESTDIIIPREQQKTVQTNIYYWKCGVGYWGIGANSHEISQNMTNPTILGNNIFCCGEHYSENFQQWIEGALETSERVLSKLSNHINQNI
jgi:monoamine oxidase